MVVLRTAAPCALHCRAQYRKNSPKFALQPRSMCKDCGQSEGGLVELGIVLLMGARRCVVLRREFGGFLWSSSGGGSMPAYFAAISGVESCRGSA